MSAVSPGGFAHAGYVKIGEETYPCALTEMSSTCATLTFDAPIDLPEHFAIQLTADGRVVRTCSISWHDGRKVGVIFGVA